MNSSPTIDELFQTWRAAAERGRVLPVDELCREQPELARELERRVAAWRKLHQTWDDERIDDNFQADLDDSPLTGCDQIELGVVYRQVQHLATGGIGVVYEALDSALARTVAIKTRRLNAQSAENADRFVAEARITAGLDHPGIVPVYGMGQTPAGDTFYVMRLVRGKTMGDAIETFHQTHDTQSGFTSREFHDLLGRFAAVCKSIAYAHSRGIIHCDIKPRNILLGRYGETVVLDWGAARTVKRQVADKRSGEETLVLTQGTHSDSAPTRITGTLPYMSPEQAAGSENLTRQSDAFSLGVTLYSILTGKTPYTGTSTHEIRQQIIRGDFPGPRRVRRGISPAIEAICLKAMANEPDQRYAATMDLADDVERFLADETISWFREPIPRRLARSVRRHRNAATVGVASLLVLAVLTLGFLVWQSSLAQREQLARRQGLATRAALAADSLRYEIDRRIWALEEASRSPELRRRLKEWNARAAENGFDDELCKWLKSAAAPRAGELDSWCWFVNADDGRGTQVARFPQRDDKGERFSSLGKAYAGREYFHGGTETGNAASESAVAPLTRPHVTSPFQGTHKEYVIAISVPVYDDDDEVAAARPIGVIGMAVRLGDLTVVGRAIARGDRLMIANLNEDTIEASPEGATGSRRGLIMQHPLFQETSFASTINARVPRLSPETLQQLFSAEGETDSGGILMSTRYRDPLGAVSPAYDGIWLASRAFVMTPTRLPAGDRLGWVVILQERP